MLMVHVCTVQPRAQVSWVICPVSIFVCSGSKAEMKFDSVIPGEMCIRVSLGLRQNVVLGSGLRHVGLRSRNCFLQAPTSSTVKGNVKLQTPGRLHSSSIFPRKKIRAVAIAVANTPTTSFISFPWSSFGTQPPRLPRFSLQAVGFGRTLFLQCGWMDSTGNRRAHF